MRGLVKVAFTDKYSGLYQEQGQEVEFADSRMKELAELGYVELKDAPKTKPAVKAEPKEEPKKVVLKAEPKKSTNKGGKPKK